MSACPRIRGANCLRCWLPAGRPLVWSPILGHHTFPGFGSSVTTSFVRLPHGSLATTHDIDRHQHYFDRLFSLGNKDGKAPSPRRLTGYNQMTLPVRT